MRLLLVFLNPLYCVVVRPGTLGVDYVGYGVVVYYTYIVSWRVHLLSAVHSRLLFASEFERGE